MVMDMLFGIVQRRMVLVVNFFIFLKLILFALLLIYLT